MRGGVVAVNKNLQICFWNINGRKFLIKTEKIQNWLNKKFDIVFLSETHLLKGEKYKLGSFTEYHNSFSSHTDRKPRGGVSCFIKNTLMEYVDEVDLSCNGHIIVRMINGNIIFASYIAPVDSPYYDPADFSHVANAFVPVDNKCIVFGGGDMNGRVGNMPQLRPPLNSSYNLNDDNTVNDHGKELMNICNSFESYVINNLSIGGKTFDGGYTFRKGNRQSQNDIILANRVALSFIKNFEIHREGWNPSDHTPISAECQMTFTTNSVGLNVSKDILTERVNTAIKRARKIKSEDVDWCTYSTLLENDVPTYNQHVENLVGSGTLNNLNILVSSLNNSVNRSARLASYPTTLPNDEEADIPESELYDLATEMLRRYEKSSCSRDILEHSISRPLKRWA